MAFNRFRYTNRSPKMGLPPMMGFLPNKHQGHITAFLAEFVGTFLFLLFAFAIAEVANRALVVETNANVQPPELTRIFFIATGFGCSVAVNVWLFYRVSGGMFNPAVSAAICRELMES
jgi:aquaporin rerated protein, other eukaryote